MKKGEQNTSVSGYPGPPYYVPDKFDIAYRAVRMSTDASIARSKLSNRANIRNKKGILLGLRGELIQPVSLESLIAGDRDQRSFGVAAELNTRLKFAADYSQERMLEEAETRAVCDELLRGLKRYNPLGYEVIIRRFGFYELGTWTLQEIADLFDVTREWVRQVQVQAINDLSWIVVQQRFLREVRLRGGINYQPQLERSKLYNTKVVLVRRPTKVDLRTTATAPIIADLLDMQKRTMFRWIRDHSDFPRPTRRFGSDYYKVSDVVSWAFHHDLIRFR